MQTSHGQVVLQLTPDATVAAACVGRRIVGHAIVEGQANEHWHTVLLVDEGFNILACGGYGLSVGRVYLWKADGHLDDCPVRDTEPLRGDFRLRCWQFANFSGMNGVV